jgi:hypothetical protein
MDVPSTTDGSAQAIRDAAATPDTIDSRMALERELDRLNVAIGAQAVASAQHLHWTLLAQAFLLTSYLIVLVPGWSVPLPGKRWLLAAIAAYGALSLVLGYLSSGASRDRIAPLRQGRKLVEQALERIAHRPTVFSRERLIARTLADWAAHLLPLAIVAGWIALTVYTLALPFPTDARVAAEVRAEPRAATSPSTMAPRAKAPARKVEESAPAVAAEPATAEETGLAALFRRAFNAPQVETTEPVKP